MELLPANETKQGKTIKDLTKGVCSSRPTENAQKTNLIIKILKKTPTKYEKHIYTH